VFYSTQASSSSEAYFRPDQDCDVRNQLSLILCLALGDESVRVKAEELISNDKADAAPEILKKMFEERNFADAYPPEEPRRQTVPTLIFVDTVNVSGDWTSFGDWSDYFGLTLPLPPGFAVVMSSRQEELKEALTEKEPFATLAASYSLTPTFFEVPQLETEVRRDVVSRRLGLFNKRLHPSQMALMLANPGVVSLEWLYFACEELR
jgi:hypothetical protein